MTFLYQLHTYIDIFYKPIFVVEVIFYVITCKIIKHIKQLFLLCIILKCQKKFRKIDMPRMYISSWCFISIMCIMSIQVHIQKVHKGYHSDDVDITFIFYPPPGVFHHDRFEHISTGYQQRWWKFLMTIYWNLQKNYFRNYVKHTIKQCFIYIFCGDLGMFIYSFVCLSVIYLLSLYLHSIVI